MSPVSSGRRAALLFHLVGGLPGPDDDLADPAHRLAVGGDDRERAHVVQDVLSRDGFAPDTAFGESHVFGDFRIEVVAHHQHVEMLVDVLTVNGRVGLVEDGITFGSPQTLIMSGA